ncbi:MFS transporter [Corynebacterium falsenii DSM 44353]|uniref:MFS transporter n=1 Tax=Corynebacterium falsenii TaxID=108486 RepID=UPI0003E95918|nr:MFS transporter [Corynebacterium falsenii]AHI02673.1 MFS transporter [Corynebacterium falsenii DSM 44353]MDC7104469.1 MFS transporter [Corynebacterium falsenii]UBI05460.1 MFS transporter [Corynebacterium falsenii]UBI06556.1 MFS transporter [Corynebacterium falsenii]
MKQGQRVGGEPTPARADWWKIGIAMFAIGFGANHFAPLLPVYRQELDLSQSKVTFLLAIYILGLIPALLAGGALSDRYGRRAVMRPATIISLAGTLLLMALPDKFEIVVALGRLVTGVAVGLMLSAGASWLKEVTALSGGTTEVGARRATIATSAGFGLGPACSGALAQWAPAPLYTPLVVHVVLIVISAFLVWRVPEAAVAPSTQSASTQSPGTDRGHGWSVKAIMPIVPTLFWAPWVFGTATTAFATLNTFALDEVSVPIAFTGLMATTAMGSGVAVQPLATRAITRSGRPPARVGLLLAAAGMLLGTFVVWTHSPALALVAAVVLGSAYGTLMVSGLFTVQRAAHRDDLGRLTAVYYSFTYLGFFAPFVISVLSKVAPQQYVMMFGMVVALLTALATALAGLSPRRAPRARRRLR